MESGSLKVTIRSVALLGILALPLLIILKSAGSFAAVEWSEFLWALKNSLIQAALSSAFACGLGILIGFGLAKTAGSSRLVAESLCLVPSFLPSLFIILVMFQILDPFPMGTFGVVFIQAFIYAGLVAVQWRRTLEGKAMPLVETAYVLGASSLQTSWQILMYLKSEVFTFLFLIFSICFSSFAIPLAVGGGKGTNLEVLIYEKMHQANGMGEALSLGLMQMTFIFVISWLYSVEGHSWFVRKPQMSGKAFPRFPLIIMLVYIIIFLVGAARVFASAMKGIDLEALKLVPMTLALALSVGIFIYGLVMLTSFAWSPLLQKFMKGYSSPSTALVGLAIYLLKPEGENAQLLYYGIFLGILIFVPLFRAGILQNLVSLGGQIRVAVQMGASSGLIFKSLLWPQLHFPACFVAGLAALWSAGDFSLAKVVFNRDVILPQLVYGLLNSYHLDAASASMLLTIGVGIVGFFFFTGMGYVTNQWLEKKL